MPESWQGGSPTTALQPSLGQGDRKAAAACCLPRGQVGCLGQLGIQGGTPGASSITHTEEKGSSCAGGCLCAQRPDWGRQLPTHSCTTKVGVPSGSNPWGVRQARAMGSSGSPVGASPQGAWQHGELICGGILCAGTHPSNPKYQWHQDRAGKGEPCWHLSPFQPLPVHPLQAAVPRC